MHSLKATSRYIEKLRFLFYEPLLRKIMFSERYDFFHLLGMSRAVLGFIMLSFLFVSGYRAGCSCRLNIPQVLTVFIPLHQQSHEQQHQLSGTKRNMRLAYRQVAEGGLFKSSASCRTGGGLSAMLSRWQAHNAGPLDGDAIQAGAGAAATSSADSVSLRDIERRAARSWLLRSFLAGASASIAASASAATPARAATAAAAVNCPPAGAAAASTASSKVASSASNGGDTIVKRLLDEREYRTLTLPNGLRVLLVSDAAATRAAAAVDVHVGSFSDPPQLPGLAHFCEHMSFLGTTKYPGEEDFSSFLSQHGGSSNAYTDNEDTVYVRLLTFTFILSLTEEVFTSVFY